MKRHSPFMRGAAMSIALALLADILFPTAAWALSTGPSQPEVQGFTPASATDMVDLFTGDMKYNIPLLDVEGYPVNLAYSAGPGMDQEASWVGLGWNLSVGQVERNLRGIPDDFKGDEIERTMHIKPNRTYGLSFGAQFQLFSVEGLSLGLSASPSFNNYDQFALDLGISPSMRSTKEGKGSYTAGLGLTSSSNRGLTVQPQFGLDSKQSKTQNATEIGGTVGMNIGLSLNSRKGLTSISFGMSADASTVSTVEEGRKRAGKSYRISASAGSNADFDFGQPTFTPAVSLPMLNRSLSFSFTLGGALQGAHPNLTLGAFYSEQRLAETRRKTEAFGYLHHSSGQGIADAQLDYSREKDGPYSGNRPALGQASLSPDGFSVSGQSISGSYRPFRSDIGHVFDPANQTSSIGGSFGLDAGAGLLAHGGARVMVNTSTASSGRWHYASNPAGTKLRYGSITNRPDLEPVYFREADEATVDLDSSLYEGMKGDRAIRFTLPKNGAFNHLLGAQLSDGGATSPLPSSNHRMKREPRGQLFSYLDRATALHFGLEQPPAHLDGIAKPHHISEIAITATDGARSIYGLPVYNTRKEEVDFNTNPQNVANGLVSYSPTEASVENSSGKERFYSRTSTPAYAYAWLLTALVSHDYSDVDAIRGPSQGDLGTWTKFTYDRVHSAYKWRTPATGAAPDKARHIKGLEARTNDDKGTYVYGEKEVYYLQTIETKNYIATFITSSARNDAKGINENGTTDAGQSLRKLERIELRTKSAPSSDPPIKTVHFEYDYSLCPSTPNANSGKLTLTKVWFTYGASKRGVTSPYRFSYASTPSYNMLHQDRWGGYKPEEAGLPNEDFPYVVQSEDAAGAGLPSPDALAQAWCLQSIRLPSGGEINVELESDDYGFVQDKRAMRMFKIKAVTPNDVYNPGGNQLGDGDDRLWFDLPADVPPSQLHRLFDGLTSLYFRFKVKVLNVQNNPSYEGDYVSGYRPFTGTLQYGLGNGGQSVWVKLPNVPLDEGGNAQTNPIRRAAVEFARVNYATEIANTTVQAYDADEPPTKSFFYSIIGAVAGFSTGLAGFFQGPNAHVLSSGPLDCAHFVPGKSFIKLNDPDFMKEGGGHRVKSISFKDNWAGMESQETNRAYAYTQLYQYGDEDGSWGVAAYEPMMGADEIPHRQPVYHTVENAFGPDERFYMELPYGEQLFPSPVVGYSRVVVTDKVPDALRATQGTGRVVHEFYTARDFPTQTRSTSLHPERRTNRVNLFSLLGFKKIDHMHATQGFVVETNDMHGKPKSVTAYPEGGDEPVSFVRYEYGMAPMGSAWRVESTETVIFPDGTTGRATIGRDYEIVADMRQFVSLAYSGGADVKFEVLYAVIAGIPVPLCWPKLSSESTCFRTGSITKKIHRFGRLRKTIKMENGSVVSTENLAYDALTGEALVTRTRNGFQDPIYSMKFPAYWHYDGMGPAYRNIGVALRNAQVSNSAFSHPMAAHLFVPGDELAMHGNSLSGAINPVRAWVDKVEGNTVTLVRRFQAPVPPMEYRLQVIRSGRRNMQTVPMMELTTLENPLDGLQGNAYARIVNASAKEFSSEWDVQCSCLAQPPGMPPLNKWVTNKRGVWRLSKEHAWLTERTRSFNNGNSNIRRDGVYASFEPFYEVINGIWSAEPSGWTTVREVTKYSNTGQELENRDALGLYSSATFGHRGTLVKSVARNARYVENGFDGFEDPASPADCNDSHFRFQAPANALVSTTAHSGRRSARATPAAPLLLNQANQPVPCQQGKCELGIAFNPPNLTIIGSSPPFAVLPAALAGNVTFLPTADGMQVSTPVNGWAFTVTVTDATGCTINRTFHAPNN